MPVVRSVNVSIYFLLQCRVTFSDVRDAGHRAGNARGSKVLFSLQTGNVWWAWFHLWTSKVRTEPTYVSWIHYLPQNIERTECTPLITHCVLHLRYKDNPFTVGDSFGSRWDTEGGTASFTTSWALEKDDPKEEVTISSIQPTGERYTHIHLPNAYMSFSFCLKLSALTHVLNA